MGKNGSDSPCEVTFPEVKSGSIKWPMPDKASEWKEKWEVEMEEIEGESLQK
jgi:hypothetical protein